MTDKHTEFEKDIANYWHGEGRDRESGILLLRALRSPLHRISEEEFLCFLGDAIESRRFSTVQYERLTGLDFETEAEVANDLRDLWRAMYGDRPMIKGAA